MPRAKYGSTFAFTANKIRHLRDTITPRLRLLQSCPVRYANTKAETGKSNSVTLVADSYSRGNVFFIAAETQNDSNISDSNQ